MLGVVVLVGVGLAWVFTDALFGNLGGVGQDISEGADKVVSWLRDNDDWAKQHEQEIRDFLKGILPAAKEAAGGVLKARSAAFPSPRSSSAARSWRSSSCSTSSPAATRSGPGSRTASAATAASA